MGITPVKPHHDKCICKYIFRLSRTQYLNSAGAGTLEFSVPCWLRELRLLVQANDLNANISAYGLCFGFCSIAQCFPTSIFVKIMHQGEHSKLYVYPTVKDFFSRYLLGVWWWGWCVCIGWWEPGSEEGWILGVCIYILITKLRTAWDNRLPQIKEIKVNCQERPGERMGCGYCEPLLLLAKEP